MHLARYVLATPTYPITRDPRRFWARCDRYRERKRIPGEVQKIEPQTASSNLNLGWRYHHHWDCGHLDKNLANSAGPPSSWDQRSRGRPFIWVVQLAFRHLPRAWIWWIFFTGSCCRRWECVWICPPKISRLDWTVLCRHRRTVDWSACRWKCFYCGRCFSICDLSLGTLAEVGYERNVSQLYEPRTWSHQACFGAEGSGERRHPSCRGRPLWKPWHSGIEVNSAKIHDFQCLYRFKGSIL